MAVEGPVRLAQPYEILELRDGQSLTMHIQKWELGTMLIKPRYPGAPGEKEILVLRLTLPKAEKPVGLDYWDVTAQTLIAQLRPLLERRLHEAHAIRVTAHGEAPRKRFTVEVI